MIRGEPQDNWLDSIVRILKRTVVKMVTDTMVPLDLLKEAAHRFRLLGEPVRLQILNLLHAHGECHVQALVEATGQSQANVSKHLRLLLDEGLVARRQEGLYAHYSIDDPTLAALCLLVCGQLERGGHGP